MRIMNWLGRSRQIAFVIFLLMGNVALAQIADSNFQHEKAVVTLFDEELNIFYNKKGELEARTNVIQKVLLNRAEGMPIVSDKNIYHGFFSELDNLKAYTISAGKKARSIPILKKETKSDRSSYVFYEDNKVTTVYYGGLEPGASTFLEYSFKHRDVNILPLIFVQNYLPFQQFEFRVVVPDNLNIRFEKIFYGKQNIQYTKETKKNKVIHKFTGTNIPAFEPPDYMPPVKYCLSHIVPVIEDVYDSKLSKNIPINKTTRDLYKYYQSHMVQANMAPDAEVKKIADEIVANSKTDVEKAKAIFDWVKEQIRYVAFEDGYGGFVPRLAKDVCNKRYGDCKDMATLLTHLLRSQNLNAYHTWIGTRDIPYAYSQISTTAVDNHMICGLNLSGKWYFLDATSNKIPFGMVPDNLQGKEALIGVSADSFVIQKLPVSLASDNKRIDSTLMEIEGDRLKGSIRVAINGYEAIDAITNLSYKDEKDKEDYIKGFLYRGSNKCILENVKWSIQNESELTLTANFYVDNYFQTISNNIYLRTLLIKYLSSFRLKEDRVCKVDNKWPNEVMYTTVLKIPAGYNVEYKPADISLNEKNHYELYTKFTQVGDDLISQLGVTYKLLDIEVSDIPHHNQLINKLNAVYQESVHLKKQ